MKKRVVSIFVGVFCIIGIIAAIRYPYVIAWDHREVSFDKAAKAMPDIEISSNDILLLHRFASAPEIDIHAEMLNDLSDSLVYDIGGEALPQNMDTIIISVGMDSIYIDFVYKNTRTIMTLNPNGSITKTIATLKSDGTAKNTYENHNNETYREYYSRIRLF